MRTDLLFPGVHATDKRIRVTLHENGTPPLHFYFIGVLEDEDSSELTYRNVGFEIGSGPMTADMIGIEPPESIDPAALARIAGRYQAYASLAEQSLIVQEGGRDAALRHLRPHRKPARLNDDFYRLIAAEYRMLRDGGDPAPQTTLAEQFPVGKSTVSRWLSKARELGYLEAKGDDDDGE